MAADIKEKLQALSIDRSAPAKPKQKLPTWLVAAGAALVTGAIAVAITSQRSADPAAQQAAMAVASPAKLHASVVAGTVASGYVIARRSATVSADIGGRLLTVDFEEGTPVEEGQVLATLDDGLARYDLDLAQARLQSAQATVQAVQADMIEGQAQLGRAQQLSKTSTISPAALDAARTRIQALTARHEAALADAKVARVAVERQADFVERHKIRAPFQGVIIAKNAQRGEVLSASLGGGDVARDGVATLVDMTSLEVEVDVNESQIGQIRTGQHASVVLDAYPDLALPAKVVAVIPTADRDRATIQVRVAFTDIDPRIVPHMAAKVTFRPAEG